MVTLGVGDVLRWRVGRHKDNGDLIVEKVREHSATIRALTYRSSGRHARITLSLAEIETRCEVVKRAKRRGGVILNDRVLSLG